MMTICTGCYVPPHLLLFLPDAKLGDVDSCDSSSIFAMDLVTMLRLELINSGSKSNETPLLLEFKFSLLHSGKDFPAFSSSGSLTKKL